MPFPVSLMPFPMPPLVNIAVKILFQSKRLENCLTFLSSEVIPGNILALQHDCFLQVT